MKKYYLKVVFWSILFFSFVLSFECPFKKIFGISCPSCGLTRAFVLLIQLRFKESFKMHPLLVFALIALFFGLLRDKFIIFKNKFVDFYIMSVAMSFFIFFISRLLNNDFV